MVDNIKETQVELKERRPSFDWVRTHHKQESKDSTSSADTQQSDLSHNDCSMHQTFQSLEVKPQLATNSGLSTPKQTLKSQMTKVLPAQMSDTLHGMKRPEVLCVPVMSSVVKKPPTQLRFAKDPKKMSPAKTERSHGQVCFALNGLYNFVFKIFLLFIYQ